MRKLTIFRHGQAQHQREVDMGNDKSLPVDTFQDAGVRMRYAPIIREWIKAYNANNPAAPIVFWNFAGEKTSDIFVSFYGDLRRYKCSVGFSTAKSKLHISQVLCKKGLKKEILEGLNPPDIPDEKLKEILRCDIDKKKTEYINEVAGAEYKPGHSLFDILKYENIDKESFEALWDERKIAALCSILSEEDFFESVRLVAGSILDVTTRTRPEEVMLS